MNKKRLFQALKSLILFSAIFHLSILTFLTITKLDLIYLNYFNILDLDVFFPEISKGAVSQLLSLLLALIVYTFIYFKFTKKN